MIRAVIDTSTLVGQARRRDLQEAAALGLFEAIWSPWIVAGLCQNPEFGCANRWWRGLKRSSSCEFWLLLTVVSGRVTGGG